MNKVALLYEQLSYDVRGAMIAVHKELGSGHKEKVYQRALAKELGSRDIPFEREKDVPIEYDGDKVGSYRPDFVVDEKIIVEVKAVSFMPKNFEEQLTHYLKSTKYKLGLLVNFGRRRLIVKRRIYTQ